MSVTICDTISASSSVCTSVSSCVESYAVERVFGNHRIGELHLHRDRQSVQYGIVVARHRCRGRGVSHDLAFEGEVAVLLDELQFGLARKLVFQRFDQRGAERRRHHRRVVGKVGDAECLRPLGDARSRERIPSAVKYAAAQRRRAQYGDGRRNEKYYFVVFHFVVLMVSGPAEGTARQMFSSVIPSSFMRR